MDDIGLASALKLWSFAMVEDRMIDAVRAWQNTPGSVGPGGGNGFARDIPAQLIVREAWLGDYDDRGGDLQSSSVSLRVPLTRRQIAERDRVSDWWAYVPDVDRPLVALVLSIKASDRRVDWIRMKRVTGVRYGSDGIRMRYNRAIEAVVKALNR